MVLAFWESDSHQRSACLCLCVCCVACPSPMCADLGVCGCTLEDDDIQQAGDAE